MMMMMIGYLFFQTHGLLRRVLFQIPDATMLDRRLPNKAGPRPHRTPNAKRRGKRPIRLARKRKQSRPEASPRVFSPPASGESFIGAKVSSMLVIGSPSRCGPATTSRGTTNPACTQSTARGPPSRTVPNPRSALSTDLEGTRTCQR